MRMYEAENSKTGLPRLALRCDERLRRDCISSAAIPMDVAAIHNVSNRCHIVLILPYENCAELLGITKLGCFRQLFPLRQL